MIRASYFINIKFDLISYHVVWFTKKCSSTIKLFKSNLSLYSLYYAEACNEFAGPILAS